MLPDRDKLSFKMTDEEWDSFVAMSKRISDNADYLITKRNKTIMGEKKKNTGRQPEMLDNLYIEEINEIRESSVEELKEMKCIDKRNVRTISTLPLWLDDILTGVSRLDYHNDNVYHPPLSIKRLMLILSCLHEISVREISNNFGLGRKQATRYFKAIKIALPLIDKHFEGK